MVSCEGILDDQIPAHSTVDGNVITDQNTAEVALVGAYSYLETQGYQWEWNYCYYFSHLAGTTRGSGSSDGMGTEAGFPGELIFNQMESDHSGYITVWSNPYKMINAANWVIKLTGDLDDSKISAERREGIIAEATFLRFFAHFYLFRNFSYFWDTDSPYGLLYRTEPSGLSNHIQARLSVADSYAQLLEDLDYCIEHGPEHTDRYHISKWTAKAFKAKLLAMRGTSQDLQDVITIADDVINNGPFAMNGDYYSIFRNKNSTPEAIFNRFFSVNSVASDLGVSRARVSNYYRAYDWVKDLCGEWGDQYHNAINDSIQILNHSTDVLEWWSGTIIKVASFGANDEEVASNAGLIYMRLGELVVLKAEAIARTTGNASEVCTVLNPLLSRAGDTPMDPADYSTPAELLEGVYTVLIKEMVAESGLDWEASMRFTDLSTGLLKIIVQKENLASADDIQKAIMPIPIQELLINTKLVQNPGYFGN